MAALSLDIGSAPAELRPALEAVRSAFPERFGPGGYGLGFAPLGAGEGGGQSLRIQRAPGRATVRYSRTVDALRALSLLMAEPESERGRPIAQDSPFGSLGVMVDASRNGVPTLMAAKDLVLRAALMGIDSFALYCEDTYEVPGEPFFGYLRGRYTAAELRALDGYAAALGVEVYPCIQTLGHLEQILQWPAYADLRDDERIVLAGDEKTYELLEKMIAAATSPFRSRRVNLGMDEASGIGRGRYRTLRGDRPPFDIMSEHLARVRGICARLGLKPDIWSDMYFRLGSKTHSYYDPDWSVPDGVAGRIPPDVRLVYWDYYHEDRAAYLDMIRRHRWLGTEPAVALGSWTWNRFWAELDYARRTIVPGMEACREAGIRDVTLTNWGDDGMEVDIRSALPAWQLFAQMAWAGSPDEAAAGFRGSVGGDLAAWVEASALDRLPGVEVRPINPSKVLLYEDPLLGMWEPHFPVAALPAHYAALAGRLARAAAAGGPDDALAFPAAIARVLAAKTALRPRAAAAYAAGDGDALRELVSGAIPALEREVESLWLQHRRLWLGLYSPFGLEVLEMRYGFVMARLASMRLRLADYLEGRAATIPELEARPEIAQSGPAGNPPLVESFSRIATPSAIA